MAPASTWVVIEEEEKNGREAVFEKIITENLNKSEHIIWIYHSETV